MLDIISIAAKEYIKKPIQYAWAVLISVILDFITLGALVGASLIIYYILSLLNLGDMPILVYVLVAAIFVVYLVVMNGLKGALVNAIAKAQKERVSVREFFKYALARGETFFGITLIKLVIDLIFLGPVIALYIFVLEPMSIAYLPYIVGIVAFGIYGVIEFPFMYAYVVSGTQETGVVQSIKGSLSFIRKTHVRAFALYFIYGLIWMFSFGLYGAYYQLWLYLEEGLLASILAGILVLGGIVISLTLYPLIYNAAILFYLKNKK